MVDMGDPSSDVPSGVRRRAAIERRRLLAYALHAARDHAHDPEIAQLRAQLGSYLAHAIALNARLSMLEHARPDLAELRARLAATSARIDRATRALLDASRSDAAQPSPPRRRARGTPGDGRRR
jgi:hypothetical protein